MTTVILLTLGVTLSADISGGCGPEKKPPVNPTEWRTAKAPPADAVVNPIAAGEDAGKLPLTPPPQVMPSAPVSPLGPDYQWANFPGVGWGWVHKDAMKFVTGAAPTPAVTYPAVTYPAVTLPVYRTGGT